MGISSMDDILGMISDALESPFAPILVIMFLCCCCCCCIMVTNIGGGGDTLMDWAQSVPIVGESFAAIANIYVPILRAEVQESGLGPYLAESGPFGTHGYIGEFWTIFQNPWVLDWEQAREEEVNPVYDRGIIVDDIDMIPSQPLSEQRAKLKITVRNTEQDVSAYRMEFFVANNEEVKQKTGIDFRTTEWIESHLNNLGNCYYSPCGAAESYDPPSAYEECVSNNDYFYEDGTEKETSEVWYDPGNRDATGPCCEICGDIDQADCDTCLEEHNEVELKDKRLPPHLSPLDTVSLVAPSSREAHRVTRHEDVSMHTSSMDVVFAYQFEPLTNIFCTDARGMDDNPEIECPSEYMEFESTNEKEMSSYTFTILEPGDYTDAQLLDWESKIVNYIAGGPVKAHVIHRKTDVYYREEPIFIHYKIENVGSDTDANEMVFLNPAKMRIIIPGELLVDPESDDFLACKRVGKDLPYALGGKIEDPWVCVPEIGGDCVNYPPLDIFSGGATPEFDYTTVTDCLWEWMHAEQGINFYEGGSVEIPFQLDTDNAVTDKEYTISLIFLGETAGVGEASSAYSYRLLQTKVVAVQPTVAGTVE